MRTCVLTDILGQEHVYDCYEANDFPYADIPKAATKCRRRGNSRAAEYLTAFGAYDIESSTVIPSEGSPFAFMYHWQVCINNVVCYGRTWKEWQEFLAGLTHELKLSSARRLVLYVHNLPFEYQYMSKFLGEHTVFAVDKRKPLKVSTTSGIEFRCSWKLTNMSLDKACRNEKGCMFLKASGDLDYRRLRTPSTWLDDTEFKYCILDVVTLWSMVKARLANEHDSLESIPMTSTGYVRRDCRRATEKDKYYREFFKKNAMTEKVYTLLKEAGRGGDTHANRYLAGRIIHDVDAFDVQSSYPAMMCLKKFPITRFTPYGQIETKAEFQELLGTKACLFRCILVNLRCKRETVMPYISFSKCLQAPKAKLDNGRILSADYVYMTITDVDFKIIQEQYDFDQDSIYIEDMHTSEYGYLPECLLSVVREYFRLKTVLKGDREKASGEEKANLEYLYAKSKNRLNGIFGMCYTDPIRDTFIMNDDGEWEQIPGDIPSLLERYNSSRNSFLIYAWGVWITAHARMHLYDLVCLTGTGTVYCDTDSSYAACVDHEKIDAANREIAKICDERNAYCDYGGKRYYMGIYECDTKEGKIRDFKTLGAKKYAYTDNLGVLHVTISGVSKAKGSDELKSLDNFHDGFIFREAGGNTIYYNDCDIHTIEIDGEKILTAGNAAVTDSTYEIGITDEYSDLIGLSIDNL